jgi:hypothetical protein
VLPRKALNEQVLNALLPDPSSIVFPAKAGIHWQSGAYSQRLDAPRGQWIPAFAGMTERSVATPVATP